MKLLLQVVVIQTFCTAILIAGNGNAQSKSVREVFVSLDLRGASLVSSFEEVERKTGIQFSFEEKELKKNVSIRYSSKNATVEEFLLHLSEKAGLKFRQVNNVINVSRLASKKENVLEILQDVKISGKISDENNQGLPGASVVVSGTSTGTTTDLDGNYSLSIPEGSTLTISFVGYVTQQIAVGGRAIIDIQMQVDAEQLEEVVVIGYGTQRKADVTGAIASMDAKSLNERPIARVDQALVGQMAGVRVKQTSGVPGRGFSIQVRGTGSITANNEPLYVIDGFPLEVSNQTSSGGFSNGNPLANLNPNDIASIEVLKDAASASIYGSRGSNGVVLITTKKGKSGKPQISFNTYAGWNETAKKLDVLSSEEWIDRQVEHMNYFWVRDHAGQGATSSNTNDERRAILGLSPGEYNTKYMPDDRWSQPGHPGLDYVDWQDLLFRKGRVQSYQLSATGGNDITKYYVSGDYLDQEGIAVGVNYERLSARANIEVTPNKNVKFGLNIAPSYSTVKDPGVEGKDAITHITVGMAPVVESESGALLTNVGDFTRYAWGTSRVSPIAEAQYVDRNTKVLRNISSAFFEYQIVDGLKFRTSLNFDIQNSNSVRFTPSFVTRNRTASASKSGYTRTNFVNENTLGYSKVIGEHSFNLLAGYSFTSYKFEDYSISGSGFASDDIQTLNAASSTSGSSGERKNVLISYFGRIQYDYKAKYLIQASLRRDGSSKFGDNTKWGIFPSFSAGWRLSEESFLQNSPVINDLKLRASWGLAGNNGVGDYDQIARLAIANYSYGGSIANGQVPRNFPNADLGWESSETLDVGFDLGLIENRLYVSFDYYTKRNKDLLLNIPVPTASGFGNALTNIGEVLNKGWEIELNTKNSIGEIKWNSQVNFSHNTNKVIALGPNNTPIYGGAFDINHNILEVGRPMYTLFVVPQDGLLTSEDIANNYPTYGSQQAGDPKYVDVDGDGAIDPDDRTYSGHPNPDFTWGITNTLNYKGFDVNVLIQGQWGGTLYSTFGRGIYRTGMGSSENTLGKVRDRVLWVEGQELTAADVTGKDRKSPSTFGRIKSTDWLYSNDYWRIRNITFGYDLGRLINSEVISGARIYMTLENWFGADKYDGGFNPEAVNNSGDDYGAFPLSKSIVFGVNLKL